MPLPDDVRTTVPARSLARARTASVAARPHAVAARPAVVPATASAALLAVLLAAVLLVGCTPASPPGAASTAAPALPTGVWEVQGSMGGMRVPGRLELLAVERSVAGRLTFDLPTPIHMAVRAVEAPTGFPGSLVLATSSPGAGARLHVLSDTLAGRVSLTGGREVHLEGRRLPAGERDPDLGRHLQALEPWLTGTGPLAGWGLAFPTFHAAGERLWVSAYDGDFGRHEVWEMRWRDGGWVPVRRVLGDGPWSDRAPSVTPDGRRLLFASTRPDAPGPGVDYDLWEAELGPDGLVGEPRRLPPPVNGPADDYQPRLLADGSLLFTSNREGGPGGQDLWHARPDGDRWLVAAAGSPPNTVASELDMLVRADGEWALVATSQPARDVFGGDDLRRLRPARGGEGWIDDGALEAPVNGFANEYGATLTPDGRWLVFASDRLPPAALYRVPVEDVLR